MNGKVMPEETEKAIKVTPEEAEKAIKVTPEEAEKSISINQECASFVVIGDEAYTSEIIEEYNRNAEVKTEIFNTNAEGKTLSYNDNAANKMEAFDNNYDNKVDTFNSNANTQIEEFNAYALTQTNNFNDNASSAINDYNLNAEQKINEFMSSLPIASKDALGCIKVGANLTIEEDGTLNALPGSNNEGIKEETDPVFSSSPSASITNEDIGNWNNKSEFDGAYSSLTGTPIIPTKTSELTNDSYFASESYVANAIENAQQDYATIDDLNNKVDKVVGKSLISDSEIERLANITNYDDTEIKNLLNSKADKGAIPTKVSQLTNDSGYINKIPEEYITETKLNDKNYATQNELATGLSNLENAKAEKSDVKKLSSSYDALSTKVSNNETAIGAINTTLGTKSDISTTYTKTEVDKKISDLVDSSPEALDTLNELAAALGDDPNFATTVMNEIGTKADANHNHDTAYATKSSEHIHSNKTVLDGITEENVSSWSAKSDFSGNYNDLTNKPVIPTVPTDISELNNDVGYITSIPSEYVTETELNAKGYLTEHQDLSGYAKKEDLHFHENKSVLDSITQNDIDNWNNNNEYTLPIASATTLGGIKVGANLSIDTDGTLNADKTTVINELTNTSKTDALSANMGRELNNRVLNLEQNSGGIDKSQLLDMVYPIGSLYMSMNETDPKDLFGGTWERIKDRFIYANGDATASGTLGGSTAHNHGLGSGFAAMNIGDGGIQYQEKQVGAWGTNAAMNIGTSYDSYQTKYWGIALGGATDNNNNIPPYITAYIWKRTA